MCIGTTCAENSMKEVGRLKELQFFGEAALLDSNALRGATIVVVSPKCELLMLTREAFNGLKQFGIVDANAIKELQKVRKEMKAKDTVRMMASKMLVKGSGHALTRLQLKRAIKFAAKATISKDYHGVSHGLATQIQKALKVGIAKDDELMLKAYSLFAEAQRQVNGDVDPGKFKLDNSLTKQVLMATTKKNLVIPHPPKSSPPPPPPGKKK